MRIDSTPSGADVSLVDRGKTTFLGTTPINASVDPSRSYDVVFTYANKPTRVEHLDPRKTTRLAITLGKTAKTETPKADVPKAPKVDKKAITEVKVAKPTKPVAKVAEPFADDTAARFAAMAVIVALPVAVVYIALQRNIVGGLTTGSVKG